MTSWLQDVFEVRKPVIGMCHLLALPGDPGYDATQGMAGVVEYARHEIRGLQDGGVDGLLISNEFSLPYLTHTEPITATTMARVVGELLHEITVPFGVNVLWDATASIDLAVATGATFVREIFTGAYVSDFGVWDTNVGAATRHQRAVGGQDVRLLFNIVPEAAAYLAPRDLASVARSTVFNCRPDGLCISGLTAGTPTDTNSLRVVKEAAGTTPVIVNTGVRASNVAEQLTIADAAIVGTFFKHESRFENSVDIAMVRQLMAEVVLLREELPADA